MKYLWVWRHGANPDSRAAFWGLAVGEGLGGGAVCVQSEKYTEETVTLGRRRAPLGWR